MADARVVHVKHEPYDVYIGRGVPRAGFRRSKWSNPYEIGKHGTRREVILKYERHLLANEELMGALPELRGKVLGCWCAPNPCHGDVLVRWANE
jgi:Domain of unknown function (DUF4326)